MLEECSYIEEELRLYKEGACFHDFSGHFVCLAAHLQRTPWTTFLPAVDE